MFNYRDDYLGTLLTNGPLAARCQPLRRLRSDDFGPRVQAVLRDDDETMVTVRGVAIADAAWRRASRRLQAVASVEHPYVASLLAYGRHEGLAYLVHEHDDGPRLVHVLRERGGRLPLAVLLPVFCQVVQAVGEAHRRGVVVGAVRPQDLRVVQAQDEDLGIRIRNFGLDVVLGVPAGRTKSVDHPSILRAPEADIGLAPSSDVFSLGVLFVRLLTGPLPRIEDPRERVEHLRERMVDAIDAGLVGEGLGMRIADTLDEDATRRPYDATRLLERLLDVVPASRLRLSVDANASAPAAADHSATHWPARQWTVLDAWERPSGARPGRRRSTVGARAEARAARAVEHDGSSAEVPVVSGATVRVAPISSRRVSPGRRLRRVALGIGLLSTASAVAVAATVREAPAASSPAAMVPAASGPAPLEPSTLLVSSSVDGELVVDGRVVGRTNAAVALEPGVHVVRVQAPAHRAWRSRVDVRPGQSLQVTAVLASASTEPMRSVSTRPVPGPSAVVVSHQPRGD
ncbi:MAG: PEGA domain-containing protein [Nannocystaceae bacterium]